MVFRCLVILCFLSLWAIAADTFTVATFNVENYFLTPFATRKSKTTVSRAKVAEAIVSIKPDVLALQEMGRKVALADLRNRLSRKNLIYPHVVWLPGPDSAIHLAVLSQFPIVGHYSKTNVTYLLDRKRFQVSRGFVEIEIQVNPDYKFTLFNAHLKSMRQVTLADHAEMRLEEARALRRLVEKRLKANPVENILLVGDLNEFPSKDPVRVLIGKRSPRLVDLRPFEKNEDQERSPVYANDLSRRVTWTHFYRKEDRFSRLDYILASQGMMNELDSSFVHVMPDWGVASDHRPVVARFATKER